MSETMNIYETFNNLRYHHENEVLEFFASQVTRSSEWVTAI